MEFAGVVGLALRRAPMLACGGFGGACRGQVRLRRLGGLALVVERRARGYDFAIDVGQAAALREAARGAGRRMRVGGKAVPAPEIAVARNQALAGLEQAGESRAIGALDHADLGETARKLRRRLHVLGKSLHAVRQRRIGRIDRGAHPAHGVGLVDRRVEIVAERGAKRDLVALLDGHLVDHRRPHAFGLDRQKLHQRLGFGVEALHRAFGVGERDARRVEVLAGGAMRGFGGERRLLGLADGGLRAFDRGGHRREVGPALGGGGEAGFDIGDFAFHARDALGLLARGRRELVPARGEVGERSGQFAEGFFRGADDVIGLGRAGIDAGAAFGAGPHFVA